MRGSYSSDNNAQRRTTKSNKQNDINVTEEDSLAVHMDVKPHIGLISKSNGSLQMNAANSDLRQVQCAGWCRKKSRVLARKKEWSMRQAMCSWKVCSGCDFRFCPENKNKKYKITSRTYKCTIVKDESLGYTYQTYDSVHAELDCSCCRTGDTKSCCVPFQN